MNFFSRFHTSHNKMCELNYEITNANKLTLFSSKWNRHNFQLCPHFCSNSHLHSFILFTFHGIPSNIDFLHSHFLKSFKFRNRNRNRNRNSHDLDRWNVVEYLSEQIVFTNESEERDMDIECEKFWKISFTWSGFFFSSSSSSLKSINLRFRLCSTGMRDSKKFIYKNVYKTEMRCISKVVQLYQYPKI